jgi:hypothetical protein
MATKKKAEKSAVEPTNEKRVKRAPYTDDAQGKR